MRVLIAKFTSVIILSMSFIGIANAQPFTFVDIPFKSVTLEPEGGGGKSIKTFYRFKDDEQALVCSVSKTDPAGVWMSWQIDPSLFTMGVLRSYESNTLTPGSAGPMGYINFSNKGSFPVQVSCEYVKK